MLVTAFEAIPKVPEEPPTRAPKVPEYVRTEPMEGADVATL